MHAAGSSWCGQHLVQMAGSGQALTWQALQPLGAKVGHHNRHGGAGDAAAPAPMTGQGGTGMSTADYSL